MTYHDIQNKDIGYAKSKRRINNDIKDFSDSNVDLADRIDSLQRAFANERGENHRFREAVRAKLGIRLPEEDKEGEALSVAYYQDQLKLIWHGVKRSKLYEYDMIQGINCICCSKILQAGNDNDKKSKSKLGRKPGGHNKK